MRMPSKTFNTHDFLKAYLREKPLFLSMTRSKEAHFFQKYLPLRKPILDVGCGDGYFAKITFAKHLQSPISNLQLRIEKIDIGLDLKESRIKQAQQQGVYVKLVTYDGIHIPFPNNHFQTVISNCVLEHIPSIDETLSEILRVLKKGGVFLTTVMSAQWEKYLLGNIFLGDMYKKWMRKRQKHHTILNENQWREKFQNHKYRIIDEIGYIDKSAVRWIDFLHYLCIPNLITYKIFHKWVLWPPLTKFYPTGFLACLLDKPVTSQNGACIFFVLGK